MRVFIVVLAALLSSWVSAQDRFADVVVEATPVRGGIHMLTGAGGNIGATVGDDGLLIIDDQYAPLAERIAAALAELAPEQSLRYIINTHFHGDHTGTNSYFADEQGATILAQEQVRVRLLGNDKLSAAALPVLTWKEGIKLYFNGEEIQVRHLPGHTDGDSVVYFTESNVLHTGDLLFNQRFPFIDRNGGGSVKSYLAAQAAMLEMIDDDTLVIPGHGPLASKADMEEMHAMIRASYESVQASVNDGLSLDEILEKGLPHSMEKYAWAFINEERWLQLLHADVTAS
jgi:glyoxylase-like metal-dependent hydrolase (beta-lactamase superfamily II)